MSRKITTHCVNELNEAIEIKAMDEPGAGGANHLYEITGFNTESNPSDPFVGRYGQPAQHSTILFQNGPIAEAGVNGISNEAILAVLIDRMAGFQKGPYSCRENAIALTKLEEAMLWMLQRTRIREARGVEGTSKI